MKKSFFVILLVVFVFSGCNYYTVVKDVSMMEATHYQEGEYYTRISLVPDFELRTLQVNYVSFTENLPEDLMLEGIEPDIETVGVVGGDYYDDFSKIVRLVSSEDFVAKDMGKDEIFPEYGLYVRGPELEVDIGFEGNEGGDYNDLKEFITEIEALFEEEIY